MPTEKEPAKRFYKTVDVIAVEEGKGAKVTLDGREIKTPAKAPLILPTKSLAEAIAEEWDRQKEVINPHSMGIMQLASTAIDRVEPQKEAVVGEVARYSESDLLCYWADHPAALVERQAAAWQPILDWAAQTYDAKLKVTSGIVHVSQPKETLDTLRAVFARYDPFELTAVHTATAAMGSVLLALALEAGRLDADAAYAASTLDEKFQEEQWGEDAEATARAQLLQEDIRSVGRFLELYRS